MDTLNEEIIDPSDSIMMDLNYIPVSAGDGNPPDDGQKSNQDRNSFLEHSNIISSQHPIHCDDEDYGAISKVNLIDLNQTTITSLSEFSYLSPTAPSFGSVLSKLPTVNITPIVENPSTSDTGSVDIAEKNECETRLESLFTPPPSSRSTVRSNSPRKPLSNVNSINPRQHLNQNELAKSDLAQLREQLNFGTKLKPPTKIIADNDSGDRVFRWQRSLYHFLNHPSSVWALSYHGAWAVLFLVYTFMVLFTNRTTWHYTCVRYERTQSAKAHAEHCLVVYFAFEFVARFWSSRSHKHYSDVPLFKWVVRYFSRPSHIFDLALLVSGLLAISCRVQLPLDFTQDVYALIALRGLHRLFNVVQWTSVYSRISPWVMITEIFHEGGSLLFGLFYLELLAVFITAYLVFLAESYYADRDSATITNMVDSLYCLSITLLTIGYGDISPVTYVGQAITGIGIWIALALFALPSGVIATSVAIKINEQERLRKHSIRRTLAAILIQRAWRFVRRQRRFELSRMLANGNIEATTQTKATSIRLHEKLCAKIAYIIERRNDFYASQFIQLILIKRARKEFSQLRTPNIRASIKAYWTRHQEVTTMLETFQGKLDKTSQQFEMDRNQTDHQLFLLEQKLQHLSLLINEQHHALQAMI